MFYLKRLPTSLFYNLHFSVYFDSLLEIIFTLVNKFREPFVHL